MEIVFEPIFAFDFVKPKSEQVVVKHLKRLGLDVKLFALFHFDFNLFGADLLVDIAVVALKKHSEQILVCIKNFCNCRYKLFDVKIFAQIDVVGQIVCVCLLKTGHIYALFAL